MKKLKSLALIAVLSTVTFFSTSALATSGTKPPPKVETQSEQFNWLEWLKNIAG